jgi:E3 ubiquitin-protein ligase TRIP12
VSAEVEALCLTFTLPGSPSTPLVCLPGGSDGETSVWWEAVPPHELHERANSPVTARNLHVYQEGLYRTLAVEGIAPQARAFLLGLSAYIPVPRTMLSLITTSEWLDVLSCGDALSNPALWTVQAIRAGLKPGPKYSSIAVQLDFLAQAVSDLPGPQERKLFLRFISGAARIPSGGFGARPITVAAVDAANADHLLPSCSTCTLTLKLPRYSSLEILSKKLDLAIREGQEDFSLD